MEYYSDRNNGGLSFGTTQVTKDTALIDISQAQKDRNPCLTCSSDLKFPRGAQRRRRLAGPGAVDLGEAGQSGVTSEKQEENLQDSCSAGGSGESPPTVHLQQC